MFGMLTALTTAAIEQVVADLPGDFDADVFLRFRGRGAEVRSEDEIGQAEERVVGRRRLGFEDIEGGAGDSAGLECFSERRFVDQVLRARS